MNEGDLVAYPHLLSAGACEGPGPSGPKVKISVTQDNDRISKCSSSEEPVSMV